MLYYISALQLGCLISGLFREKDKKTRRGIWEKVNPLEKTKRKNDSERLKHHSDS